MCDGMYIKFEKLRSASFIGDYFSIDYKKNVFLSRTQKSLSNCSLSSLPVFFRAFRVFSLTTFIVSFLLIPSLIGVTVVSELQAQAGSQSSYDRQRYQNDHFGDLRSRIPSSITDNFTRSQQERERKEKADSLEKIMAAKRKVNRRSMVPDLGGAIKSPPIQDQLNANNQNNNNSENNDLGNQSSDSKSPQSKKMTSFMPEGSNTEVRSPMPAAAIVTPTPSAYVSDTPEPVPSPSPTETPKTINPLSPEDMDSFKKSSEFDRIKSVVEQSLTTQEKAAKQRQENKIQEQKVAEKPFETF